MSRVLIVRYEGQPFDVRMSKVIAEMRDTGWECDVLVPAGGRGLALNNVAAEFGRDLAAEVGWREFPVRGGPLARVRRVLTVSRVFGTPEFERCLAELLRRKRYDLVWVKESPCLPRVFRALGRSPKPPGGDRRGGPSWPPDRRAATEGPPYGGPRAVLPPIPVVCDLYENSVEQQYDTQVRFGTPLTRLAAALRRLFPRLVAAERTFLPLCDRVFVVIEEMQQHLVEAYGLDPARVVVVHNVEKLSEFDSIPAGPPLAPGSGALVTYVGGTGVHRGLEELVAAGARLARDPDCPGVQIVIVGPGEADRARLQALADAAAAGTVVRVLGRVTHRALMQWVKQSSVGIVPHRDTGHIRTTIPNKLFQYMAAGVPVVVSDVGPLGRIVREIGCGLVFRPGSADDLARQIKLALSRPEERQAWGANGRCAVEERYSWEREGLAYQEYLRARAAGGA